MMKGKIFSKSYKPPHTKTIQVIKDGKEFICTGIVEAAKKIGISSAYLSVFLKAGKKEYNGIKFKELKK